MARHFNHRRKFAENKPHAHHESHLHTTKVVTILIPSFHGRNAWDHGLPFGEDDEKTKTPAFLESRAATASSTKKGKLIKGSCEPAHE